MGAASEAAPRASVDGAAAAEVAAPKQKYMTSKEKQVYIMNTVMPFMEDLSAAYYAESPLPEDVVTFLIDKVVQVYGLQMPETGDVDEKQVQRLAERCAILKNKMNQIQTIESTMGMDENAQNPNESG